MTPIVRPVATDDVDRVRAFLDQLSEDTAFRRFLTGIGHPPLSMVRRLVLRDAHHGAFVAEHEGQVVGHALWSRTEGDSAELAMVVADEWQHRGVGRALGVAALADAEAHGVSQARMSVHMGNHDVIELVAHLWPQAEVHEEDGLLVYDVALAA